MQLGHATLYLLLFMASIQPLTPARLKSVLSADQCPRLGRGVRALLTGEPCIQAPRGIWARLFTALLGSADNTKAESTEQASGESQSGGSIHSLHQLLASLRYQVCSCGRPFLKVLCAMEYSPLLVPHSLSVCLPPSLHSFNM